MKLPAHPFASCKPDGIGIVILLRSPARQRPRTLACQLLTRTLSRLRSATCTVAAPAVADPVAVMHIAFARALLLGKNMFMLPVVVVKPRAVPIRSTRSHS